MTTASMLSRIENRANFSTEQLEALVEDLCALEPFDAQLPAAAARYVADGVDEHCLASIAEHADAGLRLQLSTVPIPASSLHVFLAARRAGNATRPRHRLLAPREQVLAEAWIRLGRVYASAAGDLSVPVAWPRWFFVLLAELVAARHAGMEPWPLDLVTAILSAAGESAELPLRWLLLEEGPRAERRATARHPLRVLSGWPGYLAEHEGTIREALREEDAETLRHRLECLEEAGFDFRAVEKSLQAHAAHPRTDVRRIVTRLLSPRRDGNDAEIDEPITAPDDPTEDSSSVAQYLDLIQRSKSSRTKDAATRKSPTSRAFEAFDVYGPSFHTLHHAGPEAEEVEDIPLPDAVKAEWRRRYREAQAAKTEGRREGEAGSEELEALIEFVERLGPSPRRRLEDFPADEMALGETLEPPGVKLLHVVRLDSAIGHLRAGGGLEWRTDHLDAYRERSEPSPDLHDLADALATLDIQATELVLEVLAERFDASSFLERWPDETLLPFFEKDPFYLYDVLESRRAGYHPIEGAHRRGALKVLAKLPQLPDLLVETVWDLAFGGDEKLCRLARRALARTDATIDRVGKALGGNQRVRAQAALWLAELAPPRAASMIEEAYRVEMSEKPKAAMLEALDRLGVELEHFLDRGRLLEQAREGLQKKLPAKLADWFPFDELPAVHWRKDAAPLPPELVRWWVVQATKRKKTEPDPLQRRLFARCRRRDLLRLAHFVLDAWIEEDSRRASREEAEALARKEVERRYRHRSEVGRKYGDRDRYRQALAQKYRGTLIGNAIAHKGLLVLATAGDVHVARKAARYFDRLGGKRPAHCKALIDVIASIDEPVAARMLFAIARRARLAPSIRQAAEKQLHARAGQQGLDQLADGAIPEEPANEVEEQEARRLYEAFCGGRTWRFADWRRDLASHAVVGPLCSRLVWRIDDENAREKAAEIDFRPLENGDLVGADDAEVEVPEQASIRLASGLETGAERAEAWRHHFATRGLEPLLRQFARPVLLVDDARRAATELTDLQGHVLGSRRLRRRAHGLGWSPTKAEAGVHSFLGKTFAWLGLQALIACTGFHAEDEEEEEIPVAVIDLFFTRLDDGVDDWFGERLPLGRVPPVLLAECHADLVEITAGSAYDSEWRSQGLFH